MSTVRVALFTAELVKASKPNPELAEPTAEKM
jgi:hypothetical protein